LPHLTVTVQDGEICVGARADGEWADAYRPVLGYWQRSPAESPVVDGVLHTGDIGSVSDDGFVSIHDRKNLLILRGGANVYPAEVERVINGFDGVAASAVLGVADERLGQRVVAVVEGAVDVEALLEFCRSQLAKYKVPERVVVVDAMPRNSMGKIQRPPLLDLF
jgi:long-chain acyl-CoA synthetase